MAQQIPLIESNERKPFIVGLTLAGAVSAGAYSAGVLDFLFEALSEWQAAKDRRDPGVPMHDVLLTAVSGASAGGITGAIGLLSLAGGIRPGLEKITPSAEPAAPGSQDGPQGIHRVLPELYDAWVTGPRLFGVASSRTGGFLDATDMTKGKSTFASLLDSGPLQQVAERVLANAKPIGRKHRFLSNPVHLFLTVTNLDGVPYVIPFKGGAHYMTNHADCVHYAMQNIGFKPYPADRCQWLGNWNDKGIEIDLAKSLDPKAGTGYAFVQSVLATSAFPFALRSRELVRHSSVFSNRAWPIDEADRPEDAIQPAWTLGPNIIKPFTTYCVAVDGGTTDNQPFEYAYWSIRDLKQAKNPPAAETADRAVIMIDPFGTPKAYDVAGIAKSRGDDLVLTHVLKTLVPALTNQARFKINDLVRANAPEVYSRYLISPSRTIDKVKVTPALASGLLEAFGGFLDQRFREHDFQLGRRNCQRFLSAYFVLHKTNPLFDPADTWKPVDAPDSVNLRPIIPLLGTTEAPIPAIRWPKIEPERVADLEKAIGSRLDTVAYKLIDETLANAFWSVFARAIWRWFRRDAIIRYLRDIVQTTLFRSEQIVVHAPDGKPIAATPHQYAVLAALTDPAWDMRTPKGIADEVRLLSGTGAVPADSTAKPLDKEAVEVALADLGALVVHHSRGHGKPMGFTLRSRQPSLASGLTRWLRIGRHFRYDDENAQGDMPESSSAWPSVP